MISPHRSCARAYHVSMYASLMQELSTRAVDARLRRMCEKKKRSLKCAVPDWLHDEWKDMEKRELLHLSLVEALKTYGNQVDAETRKKVKARL